MLLRVEMRNRARARPAPIVKAVVTSAVKGSHNPSDDTQRCHSEGVGAALFRTSQDGEPAAGMRHQPRSGASIISPSDRLPAAKRRRSGDGAALSCREDSGSTTCDSDHSASSTPRAAQQRSLVWRLYEDGDGEVYTAAPSLSPARALSALSRREAERETDSDLPERCGTVEIPTNDSAVTVASRKRGRGEVEVVLPPHITVEESMVKEGETPRVEPEALEDVCVRNKFGCRDAPLRHQTINANTPPECPMPGCPAPSDEEVFLPRGGGAGDNDQAKERGTQPLTAMHGDARKEGGGREMNQDAVPPSCSLTPSECRSPPIPKPAPYFATSMRLLAGRRVWREGGEGGGRYSHRIGQTRSNAAPQCRKGPTTSLASLSLFCATGAPPAHGTSPAERTSPQRQILLRAGKRCTSPSRL